MARSTKPPVYSRHSSGQARVRIDGVTHYLGRHGSPESHAEYARLLEDWRSKLERAPRKMTVRALCVLYLAHATKYYQKNGQPTSELNIIRNTLRRVMRLHGKALAGQCSPRMLKDVRQAMMDDGLVRTSINKRIIRIRTMFAWGVSEEHVSATVLVGLQTVKGLKAERSAAVEAQPVTTVADALVDQLEGHVPAERARAGEHPPAADVDEYQHENLPHSLRRPQQPGEEVRLPHSVSAWIFRNSFQVPHPPLGSGPSLFTVRIRCTVERDGGLIPRFFISPITRV